MSATNTATGKPAEPVPARLFPMHYHVEKDKTYYWCSCGMSKNQPLCDGAHKGTDMRPVKWVAPETKKVLMCMCKQSGNKPICDLSHLKVIKRMYGTQIAGIGAVGVCGAAAAFYMLFMNNKK